MNSVWASIIVAAFALIGTITGTIVAGNKTTALVVYRLAELEKKVEKHNTMVERTYKLETDVKTAFKRIDELRDDLKGKGD